MDMPPSSNKPHYNFWIIKLGKALSSKQYESALFCAEEALQIYNNSLAQFQNDCKREAEPFLKKHIAKAFFKKMETLSKLERQAEIPPVYDEMICRFGADNTPFIRKYLAKALLAKALYFAQLAEREESFVSYALALLDELIQKFDNETDKEIKEIKQIVAKAMSWKGNALYYALDRDDDAVKAYDEFIEKFGNETDKEIKEIKRQVAEAMYDKGQCLRYDLDRKEDAVKAYDEFIEKFGNETDIEIKQKVAKAMYDKGQCLYYLDRDDDALKAYDDLIQKFSNETDEEIQKTIKEAIDESREICII